MQNISQGTVPEKTTTSLSVSDCARLGSIFGPVMAPLAKFVSPAALPVLIFGFLLFGSLPAAITPVTYFSTLMAANLDVSTQIKEALSQAWKDTSTVPAKEAEEGIWCRRVYLDLIGRIPTVDELKLFLDDHSQEKKESLVDRLLSQEYAQQYADYWTDIWTTLLIGRSDQGTRGFTSRQGLRDYIHESILSNKPYDIFVSQLISATGANKPGEEGFNGAVNFLSGKLRGKAIAATTKTSQLFLGMQVQCTQCHNHPFNEWKQNQFWELNAFFRQARPLRRYEGRRIAYIELVDEDFPGEGGSTPEQAEVFYELRNGKLQAAYPVFVDGEKIAPTGFVSDTNRREELARLITSSDQMSKAIVNRMWAHFLGYGFTKPVDDMGPHNPPQMPELLEQLAQRFRLRSYNLKQLQRWIVLSEPYGLSSRSNRKNVDDDPALGSSPLFSRFYLRQMDAEQLYRSLITATAAEKSFGSEVDQEKARQRWLKQFVVAFGTDENDETTTFDGTIPQTLMMMNGELIGRATSDEKGGFLYRIAHDENLSNAAKINYLYLAALSRRPTRLETRTANQILMARQGDVTDALQDIWWALLNSNEFLFNH